MSDRPSRVIRLSEAEQRQRLAVLHDQMVNLEPPPTPDPDTHDSNGDQSLESLVEEKLKDQLSTLQGRDLGLAIMNAIRFLAVRAKMPVVFGSELDEAGLR